MDVKWRGKKKVLENPREMIEIGKEDEEKFGT